MFARVLLSCAFCALCVAPAAAELITISEGHHPQVNLNPDRELLFTGGTIDYLNNVGGLATIDGGTLTIDRSATTRSRNMRGGTTIFRGSGTPHAQYFQSRIDRAADASDVNMTILEGRYFRVHGPLGPDSGSSMIIEGVMSDGSFLNLNVVVYGPLDRSHVDFVVDGTPATDPNGDHLFNLIDLNIVRNNFGTMGSRADGDIDGDGLVGLSDLNHVRNHFSGGAFTGGPEYDFAGGRWSFPPRPVPEPSAAILLGVLALTTALARIACTWWC